VERYVALCEEVLGRSGRGGERAGDRPERRTD